MAEGINVLSELASRQFVERLAERDAEIRVVAIKDY